MAMFKPIKITAPNGKKYNGFYCNGCNEELFAQNKAKHRQTCFKDIPIKEQKKYRCPSCEMPIKMNQNHCNDCGWFNEHKNINKKLREVKK